MFFFFRQVKGYLPARLLRKIVTLQDAIVGSNKHLFDEVDEMDALYLQKVHPHPRPPTSQRTLISSGFTNPIPNGARAANAVGRNILTAGDKLRELIMPDTLVALITAPVGWIPGIGLGGGRRNEGDLELGKKAELMRELENVLASSCPLCESVVAGLDKPFIEHGEVDTSWDL